MSANTNEVRLVRRDQRRRQIRRRRLTALGIAVACAAAAAYGVVAATGSSHPTARARTSALPVERAVPADMRGVHVTMALASLPGKLDQYLAIPGLNTLELDVKDEKGEIGFVSGVPPLARAVGAARPFYDARAVAERVHRKNVYLIGRVVSFEDPVLSEARPQLAVHRPDGSVWKTRGGLGWLDPYDRRVWDYDLAVAEAAAKAGFDEIQFDYVRFPSDGDVSSMRFPAQTATPKGWVTANYVRFAAAQLHRLHVRVSVDVFGLSATHDLGVGQRPGLVARYVDAVYPMVYPSHYRPGEFNLPDPNADPGTTVADSLHDFRRAMAGTHARLVPWLQDFSLGRTYGLADVQAQIEGARLYHVGGFLLWNASGVYTVSALAGS